MSDPSFAGCREPDYRMQEEIEQERQEECLRVLARCWQAHNKGILTLEDLKTIKREMGL